jgi:hypothetical protein
MKTCVHCGVENDDSATVCCECGKSLSSEITPVGQTNSTKKDDAPSGGWAVLCFFFPVAGIIWWQMWKNEKPLRAKSCVKGVIVGILLLSVSMITYNILSLFNNDMNITSGSRILIVNIDSSERNYNSDEIKHALTFGGAVRINAAILRHFDPDFEQKYGQYNDYSAVFNYFAANGWKLKFPLDTAQGYYYFFDKPIKDVYATGDFSVLRDDAARRYTD